MFLSFYKQKLNKHAQNPLCKRTNESTDLKNCLPLFLLQRQNSFNSSFSRDIITQLTQRRSFKYMQLIIYASNRCEKCMGASSPLWAAPPAAAEPAGCETQEQSWSSQGHFDTELHKKHNLMSPEIQPHWYEWLPGKIWLIWCINKHYFLQSFNVVLIVTSGNVKIKRGYCSADSTCS